MLSDNLTDNIPVYLLSDSRLGPKEAKRLSLSAKKFIEMDFDVLEPYLQDHTKIADIGCGTGEISRIIALNHPSSEVYGLDADALSLEKSRANLGNLKNLHFHAWKLGSTSEPIGAPYDFILLRLLLLHLKKPESLIASLNQHLSDNATIAIIDVDDRDAVFEPRKPWQTRLLEIMREVQLKRGGTRHIGGELEGMLQRTGFEVIHAEKVFYSKQEMGAQIYKTLALPVYQFYLDIGAQNKEEAEYIYKSLIDCLDNPTTELKVCFWHVYGKRPKTLNQP